MYNTVDNLFTNVKNHDVINNFDPMEENINNFQKVCSTKNDFMPQFVRNNESVNPIFNPWKRAI